MNIEQLKARAYDLISFIEQAQAELRSVNAEIQKEQAKPKAETKDE